jgi:2,4-dienoyl-CoA reductase-like NADH-dependent reductase (Old Yellow Enzyme family)/thioredoxin reductase
MYPHLFAPAQIGRLQLKNRIIGAATVTNMATVDGSVSERTIAHYARRAQGGASIITVELTTFHPSGRAWVYMLNLWDDKYVPGFKRLVDAIHSAGAKCTIQLGHGGRQTNRAHTHRRPVAPSAVAQFPVDHPGYVLPRALEISEITELVEAIADAARRAADAGFDGVEVHGAHGYLFHQFLSPAGNLRTDEYGGDTARRCRFICEAIEAIKASCGNDFPVICKIDGEEHVPNGIDVEEAARIAPHLEKAGADAIEVSAGCGASLQYILPPACMASGLNADGASRIKSEVSVPVIVVGKIDTPELAEEIVATGKADMVALARALICDPDFPKKAQSGQPEEIRPCMYCNQGCNRVDHQYSITCVFNPTTAQESEPGFDLEVTTVPRRVLVIGGGPGGMEAARVAALRGHQVTLCDRGERLGGQMLLASRLDSKTSWTKMVDYYEHQLSRLGVDIRLDTDVDEAFVKEYNPDVVIMATGAAVGLPEIPGLDQHPCVLSVFDVLGDGPPEGRNVVVIGAQRAGADVAAYLGSRGYAVKFVVRGSDPSYVAANEGLSTRPLLMQELRDSGVEFLFDADATVVLSDGVRIRQAGEERVVPCDAVVVATGLGPENDLKQELREGPWKLYLIGDCIAPRGFEDAIREAFHLAVLL